MSIEFETDQQFTRPTFANQQKISGMTSFLLKTGIIKEESQAKAVQLAIIVANFIIAGSIFYFFVLK